MLWVRRGRGHTCRWRHKHLTHHVHRQSTMGNTLQYFASNTESRSDPEIITLNNAGLKVFAPMYAHFKLGSLVLYLYVMHTIDWWFKNNILLENIQLKFNIKKYFTVRKILTLITKIYILLLFSLYYYTNNKFVFIMVYKFS